MSELVITNGYACTSYLHDHNSIELKEAWENSKNVKDMFFVTATFSNGSKPYFSNSSNHYLLAKFKNNQKVLEDINKNQQYNTSFIFNIEEDLFERETNGKMNFVSVYYLEYGDSEEDYREVANVLSKREKVGKAGIGNMDLCSSNPPKFTFPYSDNIVVLEVSSEKSHQSVNKYCEKTRRTVNRKGITMSLLMSLSILEKLK